MLAMRVKKCVEKDLNWGGHEFGRVRMSGSMKRKEEMISSSSQYEGSSW